MRCEVVIALRIRNVRSPNEYNPKKHSPHSPKQTQTLRVFLKVFLGVFWGVFEDYYGAFKGRGKVISIVFLLMSWWSCEMGYALVSLRRRISSVMPWYILLTPVKTCWFHSLLEPKITTGLSSEGYHQRVIVRGLSSEGYHQRVIVRGSDTLF